MWGDQAWENDSAADWFATIMETTSFPEKIRNTLRLSDDAENIEEDVWYKIRAAAYCVIHFGIVFIWPIRDLQNDISLAIAALDKMLQSEYLADDPSLAEFVEKEKLILEQRLAQLEESS